MLPDVIEPRPYLIDCVYADNGTKYQGTTQQAFMQSYIQNNINQKFTRVAKPQTKGKAEKAIRTLMAMWYDKHAFTSSEHRKIELNRFINYYNTGKHHKGLSDQTPHEVLEHYFNQKVQAT